MTVQVANDGRHAIDPAARCRLLWVDSGHAIPLEKPEAIVAAIREALALPARNAQPVQPR